MRYTAIGASLWLSMCVASAVALGGTSGKLGGAADTPGNKTGAPGSAWSSLWLTPEQRAQRLLDTGHPQAAAGLFRDPRRRAYADLEAGRYADAAQLLRPFRDERSQYNLGRAI